MAFKEGVTIITCTGGRPKAFRRLDYFVCRQDWNGPCQWIIVDDVDEPTSPNTTVGIGSLELTGDLRAAIWASIQITRISPEPKWRPGQNTLARNLLAAIPHVIYDKVLFFEDDDWYRPDYVSNMASVLGEQDLAGEPLSLYYHLPSKRYRRMVNASHASLCQTGMRSIMLSVLAAVCQEDDQFIDYNLWTRSFPTQVRRAFTGYGGVVGLKGLPGRPGIGIGHRPQEQAHVWQGDPDLKVLQSWIGSDIDLYREFL